MPLCRGSLLLLSFAVLLSCLSTSSAASVDATTTIEVDGVNVTVDNEVCEVAAWRVSSWQPSARSFGGWDRYRLLHTQHNL